MTRSRMLEEIAEQPAMLRTQAKRWAEQADAIRSRFGEPRTTVLVGRGSSGNACTFAAYLHGQRTGRHPIELRPWIATAGPPGVDWSDAIVYAYSVSGESTDVAAAAERLRAGGAKIVGITNSEGTCRLGALSDALFRLRAGPERAIPATKTLCASMFAAASLAGLEVTAPAAGSAEAMEEILAAKSARGLADFLAAARTVTFLARGPALAAALDGALKLQETAAIPSAGYSAAEFRHGPIAAAGAEDRVVLLSDGGEGESDLRAARSDLRARGVPCLQVGAPPDSEGERVDEPDPDRLPIPLPGARWARTPVLAFVSQLAALDLAVRRGLDPDAPRGLKKVTRT